MPDDCNGWMMEMPSCMTRNLPDKGLAPMDLAVLSVLMSYQDREHRCFPSERTIAAHLGVSEPTVWRSIRRMKERGFITVTRRKQEPAVYDLSGCYSRTITSDGSRQQEPSPMQVQEPRTITHAGSYGPRTITSETQEPSPVNAEYFPESSMLRGTAGDPLPADVEAAIKQAVTIVLKTPRWKLPDYRTKSAIREPILGWWLKDKDDPERRPWPGDVIAVAEDFRDAVTEGRVKVSGEKTLRSFIAARCESRRTQAGRAQGQGYGGGNGHAPEPLKVRQAREVAI